MIQNRVRNPIDKIDPAAIPNDRSSLVANPITGRELDSCESEPRIICDVLPVRVYRHRVGLDLGELGLDNPLVLVGSSSGDSFRSCSAQLR